MLNYITDYRTR